MFMEFWQIWRNENEGFLEKKSFEVLALSEDYDSTEHQWPVAFTMKVSLS
jgi:hypothetical protein